MTLCSFFEVSIDFLKAKITTISNRTMTAPAQARLCKLPERPAKPPKTDVMTRRTRIRLRILIEVQTRPFFSANSCILRTTIRREQGIHSGMVQANSSKEPATSSLQAFREGQSELERAASREM